MYIRKEFLKALQNTHELFVIDARKGSSRVWIDEILHHFTLLTLQINNVRRRGLRSASEKDDLFKGLLGFGLKRDILKEIPNVGTEGEVTNGLKRSC